MDFFSEKILDHYKNPHNKGRLKDPTIRVKEKNPLCGDVLELDLKTDAKGKIKEVAISPIGCAISHASASMLSDKLKGMNIKDVENITNEDVFKLFDNKICHGRIKCVLLGLAAAKKAAIMARNKLNAKKQKTLSSKK